MIGSIWCFWFCLFFLKRQVLPIFRAKLMTPIDVSRSVTSSFRVGDYSWRQGMETKIKNIEWTQLFCPNIGSIWCFWFCPYVSSKFDAHCFCQWCPWNSFWYWSFGVGGETLTSESCSFFNLGVVPSGWVVKPWPRRVLFLLRCCSFRVGGETLTSESPFFTKVLFLQGGCETLDSKTFFSWRCSFRVGGEILASQSIFDWRCSFRVGGETLASESFCILVFFSWSFREVITSIYFSFRACLNDMYTFGDVILGLARCMVCQQKISGDVGWNLILEINKVHFYIPCT